MMHTAKIATGFCAARFGGEDAAAKAMRDQAYQDQRRQELNEPPPVSTDDMPILLTFKVGGRLVERTEDEISVTSGRSRMEAKAAIRRLMRQGLISSELLVNHKLSIYRLSAAGACAIGMATAKGAIVSGRTLYGRGVTIRGVFYRTHEEAARAIGVSAARISEAKSLGRLDFVGLGAMGRKSVTIGGVVYASRKDAADALGCSTSTIGRMIQNGDAVDGAA